MNKIFNIIKKLYVKYETIILYLIFGVLTTIISILIYALCTRLLKMGYYSSNIISWIGSVTFAFFTNRKIVFSSNANALIKKIKEFFLFYVSRIFTLLFESLILYLGITLLQINDLIVKIIANIIVIILNYVLSKFFIFKKDSKKEG